MEDTVQVVASGRKIDRITRLVHWSGSTPTVVYRKRIWPITDSCIHLDGASDVPVTPEASHPDAWTQLIARLLPNSLPTDQGECAERLRADFRDHLPDGIVQAISLLVSLGHEIEARELLVDFLEQARSPERVKRLVKLLLLFRRSPPSSPAANTDKPVVTPQRPITTPEPGLEGDELFTLDWIPEPESQLPSVDDTYLKAEARSIQAGIGAHATLENGLVIEGLGEIPDEQEWEIAAPVAAEPSKRPASEGDSLLMQRTLSLGSTALDILRYFADNPGDKAAHVEQVLGYSLPVVNSLLNGKLNQYLQRSSSGGWACQSWVPDILAALDGES